ncbi:MAG TPA: RNA polymerase factor sigma-32 [Polyangiales bacterium]|nr:RNA polymerase factor sigma-32 [Polyangiales bacterium]
MATKKRQAAKVAAPKQDADRDEERDEDGESSDDGDVIDAELVDDADIADEPVAEIELPRATPDDGSHSLARYDALQAYMRDVHRYSVLPAEQQRELAVRYVEQGDVEAARALVTSNLRLVVKIAYDYRRAYRNVMDLIQEGNIGLMQAVKKYDPYKGVKLSSYAAWWIRAYILRFILNNWRLVKLGTTQAQRKLFFNLSKEKARLSAMGIDPTPETIAKNLDVTVDDVTSMDRRLSAGEASLDAPVAGDESKSQTRVDLMPAVGERVDQLLADEEVAGLLHDEMQRFGETLKGKERQIFYERLMAEDPRTLQELGTDFGVSRERVRQLEKRLQERLKAYLQDKLGAELLEP